MDKLKIKSKSKAKRKAKPKLKSQLKFNLGLKHKRKEKMDEIYNRDIAQNITKTLRPLEILVLVIVPPMLKTKTPHKPRQKRDLNALSIK